MCRFVEVRDLFVQPIHGERVLDEIVRAEAEELHALGERVRDERGGWCLDHRAHFDLFVKRNAFLAKLDFVLSHEGIGLGQFIQPRDHGIHDLDVADDTCSEDGAELGAENFFMLQAITDRAPAEERIHLVRNNE